MKCQFALLAFAWAAASVASGQQLADMSLEGTIRRVMATGQTWSLDVKELRKGGEAGAVILTRLLADRTLTDDEIGNALVALDNCFFDPRWIEKPADREPRTALLLLRYFDFQAHSPGLKETIAETRKAILDRYAAYEKQNRLAPAVAQ